MEHDRTSFWTGLISTMHELIRELCSTNDVEILKKHVSGN